jgi:hypothetical protein
MYLLDLGHTVLEFVLDVVYPEIGWLIEMTIGIDYSKSLTNFIPLSMGFGKGIVSYFGISWYE